MSASTKGSSVEKILSKEEIADLLSAVRHGDVDVESVGSEADQASKPVGSAAAETCSLFKTSGAEGWKLKNYDLILDNFARNYALSLSTRFQRAAHIKLEAMESMSFDALLQRLSGRGAIGVLQLNLSLGVVCWFLMNSSLSPWWKWFWGGHRRIKRWFPVGG